MKNSTISRRQLFAVGPLLAGPGIPAITATSQRYYIVNFSQIAGIPCSCGTSRRAFYDVQDFPGSVHVTEISIDAQRHYHKHLTEVYYFLECGTNTKMELNEELVPVSPGMCILIQPGVRHRGVGKMKVLIFVLPKYDPSDEYYDQAPAA